VDCECPLYTIEGGRDMEHAEGNKKIVLKVLSTLLIMYILTGVALFVLAFLLYKMELTENIVTIGITAIYVVSGLLGGIIIGKRMKTRRFLWGIIMGAAYFLVLLIGSALLNRGLTSDMLHIGLTLVMCMGAGMIGGMVS
jgi:putative membrane protein, TIGR04086 family